MSDIKLNFGVNNIKIINHCIDLGIDFVGFIFNVKESHRNIDFDTAKNILGLIHNKIETVVVTKNPTKELFYQSLSFRVHTFKFMGTFPQMK